MPRPRGKLILDEIAAADRFLLTTHERPDGDAVGSLAAMQQVLTALGKDALAFLSPDELPLPYEYRFIEPEGLVTAPPEDLCSRVLVFLDCGNIDRTPADVLKHEDHRILNIDHHHDNTRFGEVNFVDANASCTAEMVWDLMQALGVEPTPAIEQALYVGLVTDTGRFMYENTGPRAHEMAAQLLDARARRARHLPAAVRGGPAGQARPARARAQPRRALRRRPADRDPPDARRLRADGRRRELLRGDGRPPALRRGHRRGGADPRPADDGTPARKVSLRATDDRIDVSRIARSLGGGGHRRAAGFSTDLGFPELVEVLRAELARQL